MSTTSSLSVSIRQAFEPPATGFVGITENVLSLCREGKLDIVYRSSICRCSLRHDAIEEFVDVPLRKGVFRAVLARVAALCNERVPDSVTPYGGQGELVVGAGLASETFVRVRFVNTPDEQKLELERAKETTQSHPARNDVAGDDRLAPRGRRGQAGSAENPEVKTTHRAWVMILRNRGESFYQAEHELTELVREFPAIFKGCYSLYGHYDVVMPVEASSLEEVHQAVGMIRAKGGDSVFSTITSLAVSPMFDNPKRFVGNQVCIGIITKLGKQNEARGLLEAISYFDVADVVFGEFDIVGLFHADADGKLAGLRQAIREIEFIQKTNTMLPHEIAMLPR